MQRVYHRLRSSGHRTLCRRNCDGSVPKPDVLNFSLNWFPLADHAAYYSAVALGYYDQSNLAVNVLQGSGSGASVRRVDIGQADCGIADTPVIINGIRNGAQIKIVAMEFDHSPDAVWTTKKDRDYQSY